MSNVWLVVSDLYFATAVVHEMLGFTRSLDMHLGHIELWLDWRGREEITVEA